MSKRWTVFETIMDEYARLIADTVIDKRRGLAPAVRAGNDYWIFQTRTFKKLIGGDMTPSTILRENKLLLKGGNECAYCGAVGPLQWEHIIPKSRGGPDTMDNLVLSCASCNGRKSARNPVEWYLERQLHRKHIPRLVMGKLLKLVLEEHRRRNTLNYTAFPGQQRLTLSDIFGIFDYSEQDARQQAEDARPKPPTDPNRREVFTIGQKGVASSGSLQSIVATIGIAYVVDIRVKSPTRGAWSRPELQTLFGPRFVTLPAGQSLSSLISTLPGRILTLGSSKDPWESPEAIELGDKHPEWEVVHIYHDKHKSSPIAEAECIPHREMVAAIRERTEGEYTSFSLEEYSPTPITRPENTAQGA